MGEMGTLAQDVSTSDPVNSRRFALSYGGEVVVVVVVAVVTGSVVVLAGASDSIPNFLHRCSTSRLLRLGLATSSTDALTAAAKGGSCRQTVRGLRRTDCALAVAPTSEQCVHDANPCSRRSSHITTPMSRSWARYASA